MISPHEPDQHYIYMDYYQLQLFQSLTQLIRRVFFEGLASSTNIAKLEIQVYYVCMFVERLYSNSHLFFFCVANSVIT